MTTTSIQALLPRVSEAGSVELEQNTEHRVVSWSTPAESCGSKGSPTTGNGERAVLWLMNDAFLRRCCRCC